MASADSPQFFTGTASWTDPTLVNSDLFYPPGMKTAADRLNFYSQHFKTVEVDATYYALLAERNARLWAERTPPDFIFNIKAFGLLTGHAVATARLPKAIKEMLPPASRSARRLEHPEPQVLELAFQMFWSALSPLRDANKLGALLFQFPPYFTYRNSNLADLERIRQRLPDAHIAVEFRHPSWTEPAQRAATMDFLRANHLIYVATDSPVGPSPPLPVLTTAADAYIRFHGHNRENWFKRDISVAERYKYLYSERELAEWADRLQQLSGVHRAFAIFNNCYSNFGIMNAATMATMLER
ncbi:MAG TPA: DUF72 domain-containing protein [Candidatus Binataceae bacterium]|nr:DUF72 domain-containing protein [Candidatus Binataceae bacterium]